VAGFARPLTAWYAFGAATVGAHFPFRITEASDPIIQRSLASVADPAARVKIEKEMHAVVQAVGSVANEDHEEMFGIGSRLLLIAVLQFIIGAVFLAAALSRPNQPPLRMPVSSTPAASASAEPTADRGAPVAPPPGIAGR
jgi:hypothetical protein